MQTGLTGRKIHFKLTYGLLLFLLCVFNFSKSDAQAVRESNNSISFGLNLPVGEFSETHIAGISLGYAWSHQRFGILDQLPKKLVGFTANGGIDYYFGKKETVAGYDFTYGSYFYLHAFGGIIYNPIKKANISLTIGPTMDIYKGSADLGFGVNWNGQYHFTDRIAIRPGVMYMKHKEANALWTLSLQVSYNF